MQLEQRPKTLLIRLCADGRKVDLEKSPILIHLKSRRQEPEWKPEKNITPP